MPQPRIGVLLVNTGTPDSPAVPHVRKYLREFLMDKRVIDIPYAQRFALINGIIAPFRAPKSAKIYRELWTEQGSPLMCHAQSVTKLLQQALGPEYYVTFAMRYQSPSMDSVLQELKNKFLEKIVVIPLFPQYASASTGSVHDKVMEVVKEWQVIPDMKMVSTFCNDPDFIKAWTEVATPYMQQDKWDHYVFSYHGLPERQILKASANNYCQLSDKCCNSYHRLNRFCYRAQCFETSRQLAAALGIPEKKYTVSFQSRLGKDPWIKPYTDEVLTEMPGKGIKKVLAFSPAFVADCLETTIEVGEEFKEAFLHAGGEKWQLVQSLNDHPAWIEALRKLVVS